jgi:hypothetical protein
MSALAEALDYAARGWAVFPLQPGLKEPLERSRGFYDSTTNPATIRRWWLADPTYNIGIRTGIASSVWILDIDGAIGAIALAVLEAKYGPLPTTLVSTTSAGCHLWFCADRPIPTSTGRIARGLDVRAEGGYVLAPPSIHPDGPIYRWRNSTPLVGAPAWLITLTRRPSPLPPVSISQRALSSLRSRPQIPDAYGQAALDAEIDALANTLPGARNYALNRASFCLHQLVAGGELDGAEVHARLIAAATANGLMSDPQDGPRAVALTIRSGARAGKQHPRNRQGRAS